MLINKTTQCLSQQAYNRTVLQGEILLEFVVHLDQSSTVSMYGNYCFVLNFTFPVFKLKHNNPHYKLYKY